jgi:hypothetical protein
VGEPPPPAVVVLPPIVVVLLVEPVAVDPVLLPAAPVVTPVDPLAPLDVEPVVERPPGPVSKRPPESSPPHDAMTAASGTETTTSLRVQPCMRARAPTTCEGFMTLPPS